jgi:hypothetical protein
MSTLIEIPANRIEESRLAEYPRNVLGKYQFSIRELLVLMLACGMTLGIIKHAADRIRNTVQQRASTPTKMQELERQVFRFNFR